MSGRRPYCETTLSSFLTILDKCGVLHGASASEF